jgi:ATP-dependent DNA helicase RecQ
LLSFLDAHKQDAGIVYCLSRKSTEELADKLKDAGYKAEAFHAGLSNEVKSRNQEAFLRDEINIIVATIAFGMGINKSNVRYVVHVDLPKNIEGYYQETGRAGRDGLPSDALLLYSHADVSKLQYFARIDGNPEQTRILLSKLDDMVKYCQLRSCRRKYLLNYFDETAPKYCGSCDVCLSEYKTFDGTLIAQKALSAVVRLRESFGINYVIDFLRGSKSEKIRDEHKALKTYGIGADISKAEWQRHLNELIEDGYLALSQDQYAVLKLTPRSEAVLKGHEKVEMIAAQVMEERKAETLPYETGLFERLKATRADLATKENVPAYLIVSDATLLELATYLPQNLEEMRLISGFGDVKLNRYGAAFVQNVYTYSLERGLSSKIKLKAPKRERKPGTTSPAIPKLTDTRLESYDLFKAGKTVDEIAALRNLAKATIESHLSVFVETGELDVLAFVAPEKIPVIADAVESYGAEKLAPLKEVLGEDYGYGEIKAVISWMKWKANNK